MNVPRVFISYYPAKEPTQEQQLIQQLINDLRAAGTEVIADAGRNTDDEFFQFIARELPTCQWVIFVQAPETLQAFRTRMIFSAALKLVEQQEIQGLLRIIPTSAEAVQAPPEWANLKTFNIAQDYPRALEQLLFTLSIGDTGSMHTLETPEAPLLPRRVSHFSSPPPTYDRPLAPPPRMVMLRDMPYTIGRKNIIIGSVVLASIIVLAVVSTVLYNAFRPQPVPNPVVGYAYFTSSELFNNDGTKGADDGINVILNNLTPPTSNNSYYVWLLPDTQANEANTILIGKLSDIQNGVATLTYASPTHDNLLNLASRILVTEENSTIAPGTPATDKSMWRYYAEIPQSGSASSNMNMSGSNSSMNMTGNTQLDHLRHLLYNDPTLHNKDLNIDLNGGIAFWFHQNIQKIMLLAKDARENGQSSITQSDAIKILDYIDGSQYVSRDVQSGNPQLADAASTRLGLLTSDPEHENPAAFDRLMGHHLTGLINAPAITSDERTQINAIDLALNQIVDTLGQIHTDAISLLTNPNDAGELNDLYIQSLNIYYGRFDPNTGNRVGGAIWIYDHIQHLSHFTIEKYVS